MYHANCEWYVDMGEHNKPLCERKGLRPAKCGECPVYIRSIEEENAKLRELVRHLYEYRQLYFKTGIYPTDHGVTEQRMRELGIEVDR